MNFFKLCRPLSLLLATSLVAACASPHVGQVMPDIPLQEGEFGRIDQVSVSDLQARSTLIRTQRRDPLIAGVIVDESFLDRSVSTEAQVLVGATSGMVAAGINVIGGAVIMAQKARAIKNQPVGSTNISVTGAVSQAEANSAADTDVDIKNQAPDFTNTFTGSVTSGGGACPPSVAICS